MAIDAYIKAIKKIGGTAGYIAPDASARLARTALAAGGVDNIPANMPASQFGPFLLAKRFMPIPGMAYVPKAGDVAVFPGGQAVGSATGQIAMYSGDSWVPSFSWWIGSYMTNAPKGAAIYRPS